MKERAPQVTHNLLTHSFAKEAGSQMKRLPQKKKARMRKSIETSNVLLEYQMLPKNR